MVVRWVPVVHLLLISLGRIPDSARPTARESRVLLDQPFAPRSFFLPVKLIRHDYRRRREAGRAAAYQL